jgi:hypothetical protein
LYWVCMVSQEACKVAKPSRALGAGIVSMKLGKVPVECLEIRLSRKSCDW